MKFLFGLLFLLISPSVFSQQSTDLTIEYTDHYGKKDLLMIEFYLKNNTNDTVLIHQPHELKYRPNGNPPVPIVPEFYNLNFLSEVEFCEIAPSFVDNYAGIPTKTSRDFVKVPPNGQQQLLYTNRGTEQMICDDKIEEVKVKFEYNFDQKFLDKAYFKKEITEAGNLSEEKSNQLYQLLENSYQGKIVSEEVTLDLTNLKESWDPELKKKLALRKIKRMYGIDIIELHLANSSTNSLATVRVADDFKEEQLDVLQQQLVDATFRSSRPKTIVKVGDERKWIIAPGGSKNEVNIYDYSSFLDSAQISNELLILEKENPILKDLKIQNTYSSLDNVSGTMHWGLYRNLFVILEDKQGNLFHLNFRNPPIYKSQLTPLTKTKEGFQLIKKSYNYDEIFVFQKLENGDLIRRKRVNDNPIRFSFNGYLLKL